MYNLLMTEVFMVTRPVFAQPFGIPMGMKAANLLVIDHPHQLEFTVTPFRLHPEFTDVSVVAPPRFCQSLTFIALIAGLSQSRAAARHSTPLKERAVFSYRVATARHSLSLPHNRSTSLRCT